MSEEVDFQGASIDADNISRSVIKQRCKVWSLSLGTTAAATVVRVRDGVDIGGKVKAIMCCTSATGWLMPFPKGAYFEYGVFVEQVSGDGTWTVSFEPLPRHE